MANLAPIDGPLTGEQYAFRAQKTLGLSDGAPGYRIVDSFEKPEGPAKTYIYSADGVYFAYTIPGSVKIFTSQDAKLYKELPIQNAVELNFSPLGTFLSTWERLVKLEDGSQHKNLRVWSVATGEEVVAFTQKAQEGWDLQYTDSESHAVRTVGPDVQVFNPSDWNAGVVDKLKVEGLASVSLSPGKNPSLAVFIGERKGAPACIRIHNLATLAASPTCQKTFYKADSATIKWNSLGTQMLLLAHTDVDKTNKSYYGETNLMLLSAAGNFDCRVSLDKEGPIHDFAWSPNSKEFGVVYGYIPSKAVLFDQRVRVIADLGTHPWNYIAFNPQGRLVALGGFGNLAGKIDIFDRRTLNKVTTIDAPNTSHCEWSGDGRTLLTATLSPRLRVDNGIRIWHCSGRLLHVHLIDELYQASFKRTANARVPAFPAQLPAAPTPSESVVAHEATAKPTPTKPAGAYRPPGARGLATPTIFKREDEGGHSHSPSNGVSPNPSRTGTPANGGGNGRYNNGVGQNVPGGGPGRARVVPGAPPPGSGSPQQDDPRKQARKKKGKKEGGAGAGGGAGVGGGDAGAEEPRSPPPSAAPNEVPPPITVVDAPPIVAPMPAVPEGLEQGLDPVAKKIRNLNKKLKAIEELKERVQKGDKLEATQLKKIDGEADIRKELKTLGAPA